MYPRVPGHQGVPARHLRVVEGQPVGRHSADGDHWPGGAHRFRLQPRPFGRAGFDLEHQCTHGSFVTREFDGRLVGGLVGGRYERSCFTLFLQTRYQSGAASRTADGTRMNFEPQNLP